jgi:hypothetical protein
MIWFRVGRASGYRFESHAFGFFLLFPTAPPALSAAERRRELDRPGLFCAVPSASVLAVAGMDWAAGYRSGRVVFFGIARLCSAA